VSFVSGYNGDFGDEMMVAKGIKTLNVVEQDVSKELQCNVM
jgi:hypothetical protein